jgi:mlo protein
MVILSMQMGSRFKKSVISENVRKSLSKWQRRVKEKQSSSYELLNSTTTTSLESWQNGMENENALISEIEEGSSSGIKDICFSNFDDVPLSPNYDEDDHDHDVKYDEFSTPSMS